MVVGMLHKIFGLNNVMKNLGVIAYPITIVIIATIISMIMLRKQNQIELNEKIDKDREFEKIEKLAKAQRETNLIF